MSLSISTNVGSLAAQRNLMSSQSNLQTSFERLSSGTRINSAKDDAAGLSIASRLQAQASGLAVAQRNAMNGISLVETADAAMGTMVDLLVRGRDLMLQHTDGTLSTEDRSAITAELADINVELDRIRTDSSFAGTKLLTGTSTTGLLGGVDIAIDASGTTMKVALDAQAGTALAAGNIDAELAGAEFQELAFGTAGITRLQVGTTTNTVNTVAEVDSMIDIVTTQRAQFGALANTFQSAIENLAAVEQGVSAAMGRIMDTDYAAESGELAKNQILQQAGTAILAQANQSSQSVMSLLQ